MKKLFTLILVTLIVLASCSSHQKESDNSDDRNTIYPPLKKNGKITKTGDLIMLNSLGKEVKIPFSFTYQNNRLLY